MTFKLGIGISYFDSKPELEILIPQIYDEVDWIGTVNGKYSNFPADHIYSEDGSDEFLRNYGDGDKINDHRWSGNEYQKRQMILDQAALNDVDFLIMWDTDEIVHPEYKDWKLFRKNLEKFNSKIPFENGKLKNPKYSWEYNFNMYMFAGLTWDPASNRLRRNAFHKQPRIFQNPGQIRYALESHYRFTFKCITDELILKNPTIPLLIGAQYTIDGLRLLSTSQCRNKKQLEARKLWSWDNMHEERARLYYAEMRLKGKTENIPENINEPHYFDERGYRIKGERPVISY
jgi:hypothetical protein